MTMNRISVAQLARELGIKPNDVMDRADEVGIALARVAATVTPAQADRIRNRVTEKFEEDQRRADRIAALSARPSPNRTAAATPIESCDCCGLVITAGMRRCSICEDHYLVPGEPLSRKEDRLADHARRVPAARNSTTTDSPESRERVASALRTRNAWRAALVEVMLVHAPGDEGCMCGAPHYPCISVATLERVNPRIARNVENYLAMSAEDMRKALYREDDPGRLLSDAG
jgi:hypothetical protein